MIKRAHKLFQLGAAFTVALSSLLLVSIPTVSASTNNCLWTGTAGGANFNNAGNWSNCGGVVPQNGDNLVFDDTQTTVFTITNDLSSTTFGNITFQGSGSSGMLVTGSTQLNGNITENMAHPAVLGAVKFLANGSITSLDSGMTFSSIDIGANTVAVVAQVAITNNGALSGSGTINFSLPSTMLGGFIEDAASPNFTGKLNVLTGALEANNNFSSSFSDIFSKAAGVVVSNGATFAIVQPNSLTGTIAEPITAAGSGVNVSGSGYLGAVYVRAHNEVVTFSGPLTLTGNTAFTGLATTSSNENTYKLTGTISGNYTIINTNGSLIVASCNNTSATVDGTYGANGVLQSAGGESCPVGSNIGGGHVSSSASSAPKSPDTGLAALKAHPLSVGVATTTAALLLVFIARRLRPLKQ